MSHEKKIHNVQPTRFRPSFVLIALLFLTLPFGAWWAVVTVLELRDSWSREDLLASTRAPSQLLRDFISGLDRRDPDPELVDKLVQKAIKTNPVQEMRSGTMPSWIDLMEALRSRHLLAPEQWSAYVETFLAEAEQSAEPLYVVRHLLRYDRDFLLEPDQTARLIRVALASRGLTAKTVQEFVLDSYRSGRIEDEDWRATVQRTYPARFVAREKVRLGTSLPVMFDFDVEMAAAPWKYYNLEGRLEAFLVDGAVVENAKSPGWPGESFYKVSNDRKFYLPLVDRSGKELPAGQHRILARVRFEATPISGTDFPPVQWSLEEETAFTVVPETAETVDLVTGPTGKLDPSDFMKDPHVEVWKMEKRNGAMFTFDSVYQPVALSYDVYWRSQDEEVRLGSFFMKAAPSPAYGRGGAAAWKEFPTNIDVAVVDIVLRPNRRLAEKEADCLAIHGEEIVLTEIPVRAVDPPKWFTRRFED